MHNLLYIFSSPDPTLQKDKWFESKVLRVMGYKVYQIQLKALCDVSDLFNRILSTAEQNLFYKSIFHILFEFFPTVQVLMPLCKYLCTCAVLSFFKSLESTNFSCYVFELCIIMNYKTKKCIKVGNISKDLLNHYNKNIMF